ncbi:MAG: prolipoprotein diacylglyceryl transferase [Clostridiales Family XIII bacterium]|nr:prolipoprotein diacylglyceryl transferase [Clostridiales Family XIII bacterium]
MESPGRVAFSIAGIEVMWYGILVAAGILAAFFVIYRRAPKYHGISQDRIFNFVILAVIAGIVGARAYYVIFNWSYYSADASRILDIRSGGLAIHGGLIFGFLMILLLCRIYKEKWLNIADLFFSAFPLGQAIGRWGNFFNSEAHGGHTDLPWAVIVNGDTVHPTFLYESIWCLLLFLFLLRIDSRRRFSGQTFLLCCILYSAERFFVEGLRTDSLMLFGTLRQAQALSACVIIAALIAYIYLYRRKRGKKKGRKKEV